MMRRRRRWLHALDAGRLAGRRHRVIGSLLRVVELFVVAFFVDGWVRDGWRDSIAKTHGAERPLAEVACVLMALGIIVALFAARRHRGEKPPGVAELRAADPKEARSRVSALAFFGVVAGVAVACVVTWVPVGPFVLRGIVGTLVGALGALWAVSWGEKQPAPRPAWVLGLVAAKEEAAGWRLAVAGAVVVVLALGGSLARLPIGGLGLAAVLIAASATQRELANRWAEAELEWWKSVTTEAGAERVRVVRASRPDPVVWPAGVDSTTRHLLRRLVGEHDDSEVAHLEHLWTEKHHSDAPSGGLAAAVEERDSRFGSTILLTADRVAADADGLALRLAERLGPEWAVSAEASALRVEITPCEPERLPARVALEELLPARAEEVDVGNLALAVARNSAGEPVVFNPSATPHAMVAGETGSGKTIKITDLAVSALAHGWQLAVCEVTKGGLDFLPLRPWASGWAGEIDEALRLVRAVYGEVRRRRDVLQAHSAVKWQELKLEVRAAENIRPLMLVFDEVASALIAGAPPRGLAKTHPLVREAEERLAATSELRLLLGKLAREARFVGISLVLGIQRPDVAILGGVDGAGGELRANLGWRCQLAPPRNLPARETVGMLFSGEATAQALSELARLNDGISPGLGVVWAEGGGVQGVRVAYHPPADIPALLDRLGVPRHVGPLLGAEVDPPSGEGEEPSRVESGSDDPRSTPAGGHRGSAAIEAESGVAVHRHPDGTPLRVVAETPGPDAARFGVIARYRLALGATIAEAGDAGALTGLLVPGFDELVDEVDRAAARIRFARAARLSAQAIVAGPLVPFGSPTAEERRVLAGVERVMNEWLSSWPAVLVDADYVGEEPHGNLVWLRTKTDREFLISLAAAGLIDVFEELDTTRLSQPRAMASKGEMT